MDFGAALRALRHGHLVTRPLWNGMMRLQLTASSADAPTFIFMNDATGGPVLWSAAQADLLADDWTLVEPAEEPVTLFIVPRDARGAVTVPMVIRDRRYDVVAQRSAHVIGIASEAADLAGFTWKGVCVSDLSGTGIPAWKRVSDMAGTLFVGLALGDAPGT